MGWHGWRALVINLMIAAAYASEPTQSIVTFDKPPVSFGGGPVTSENYYESGFWIRREGGGLGMRHRLERMGLNADGPDNGTTYLAFSRYYALQDSLVFSQVDNRSFGIVSVDVAEPNIASSLKPIFVTFSGIKANGSSVTSTYALDGFIDGLLGQPDYQRFYFDTRFASDLVRLEIPSDVFALDNLAFTVAIPEPGAGLLLGVGALAAVGWRWFKESGWGHVWT